MDNIIEPNKEGCTNIFCDYNLEKAPWICSGKKCPDHFISKPIVISKRRLKRNLK